MPPIRARARSVLLAALTLAAVAGSARAQDAEPGAEAPAAEEKARPKPKPRPKPAPKAAPAHAPAPTPAAAPAPAPAAAAVWPAGASSVSESYGDWTVTCTRPADKAACIVVQSQGDSKTGRRKFAIEMQPPRDGRAEGIILMPFGLSIDPGVTFKLDEQALGKGAPYTSCTGEGCIVPISFPTLATDGMRTAKTLTVTGQKSGGTEPATITVPLVGFPQAFDRAVALGG
ncbi:invasion associated locus B family protein [Methylobacterium sp. NEAU 140]|uniref:invasion associated locus B family protein n=1 Tax=Methylobacterium sp. NEAU 140 TaxID=3064945 RepID=UPI00273249F5|nr:invasion associated locus B family protein [Methylobacterium sp. NEAU 140]MDP4025540.1 invasion associated locus B family protein [Methylobacterium sp. NEAU 140]